jgi:membrane associated rhomboid family serine protease
MIQVRQGDRTVRLTVDEFERRVREGRVAPDAEICLPAVTGDRFVPAAELDYVQALARDPTRRWHAEVAAVRAPWLTALLVGVQVRLWAWLQLPEGPALLDRGARDTQAILEQGEIERWFTSGLLQVEFGHMAMNVLFLGWVGVHLEAAMGWRLLALLFGASVWGGAVLSTFVSPAADAIGSSGGVFGLVGAGVVLGVLRPAELPPRLRGVFGLSLAPYLLQGLVSGLMTPRIDNASHLGGLVVGVALMLALIPPALATSPRRNRAVTALTLAVMTAASAWLAVRGPAWAPIAPIDAVATELRAVAGDDVALPPPPARALAASAPRGWRAATLLDGQRGVASDVGHAAWAV